MAEIRDYLYKSPMTGREQRLFPWDKSYLRGNTSPVWVEHQYIHRTRSTISHLLLCLYIFLLYKTKPLLTGGASLFQVLLYLNRGGVGCPNFQLLLIPGCWRRIRAIERGWASIPIFSHRPKNDIILARYWGSRQKCEWRKCSAGVWWLPGLDDGWIGGGGGGEEVASLIVASVGGGW